MIKKPVAFFSYIAITVFSNILERGKNEKETS